jgi:hypothetical protein
MKKLHTIFKTCLLATSLFTAGAFFVLQANSTTETNTNTNTNLPRSSVNDIEEIQVEGDKTRLYYLYRMREAELNDVEDYRIICRLEKRTGSNMKYRVCYPQYLLQRWANETQDAMGGRNLGQLAQSAVRLPTLADIEFLVQRDKQKSLAHTEKLVKENPELMKKLVSLEEKRLQYEKAQATM